MIASEPGNTVLTPQERNQEMLVANSEAVYFYGPEGKGPCFIIGGYYGLKVGEKTKIAWYRGYLMTISKEITKVEERSSEVAAKSPASEPNTGTVLTIYDLKGKYIAYRDDFGKRIFDPRAAKAIGEPIKHVIADANEIFVITEHNNVTYS